MVSTVQTDGASINKKPCNGLVSSSRYLNRQTLQWGSVIRLSNDQEFSPLKRELAARSGTPTLSKSASEVSVCDELRSLLGGNYG